jgi:stage V sporulation protein AE
MDGFRLTPAHTMCTLVVIGSILGGFGWYDPLIRFAGAGAYVPISSFGNSLVKGALQEAQRDGLLGVLTGIFEITSGGISCAIIFGFLSSLVFKPRG